MRISLDLMSTPRLDKRVTNQDNPPELVCEMKWYLTMPCHFLQRTFTLVTSLYNYSYIYMLVTALNLPRLTAKIRARWPNATFQGQAPALGVCSRSAPQISGRFDFISLVSVVSFRRVFISEELCLWCILHALLRNPAALTKLRASLQVSWPPARLQCLGFSVLI